MKLFRQYIFLAVALIAIQAQAQKKGLESINVKDLKMHMQFLACDELEGRETGRPGLKIAGRYLAVQAEHLGLKPVDPENDFFQNYIIVEESYDRENSHITINSPGSEPVVDNDPFYIFSDGDQQNISIEGEIVFAGYGINDEENNYNDFKNIDIKDKVVLIMSRAPLNEEGTEALFGGDKWTGRMSFMSKLRYISSLEPRAVMMVMDPKSGYQSIEDDNPGISSYLSHSRRLKGSEHSRRRYGGGPQMVLIHRSVADQLLEGYGRDLKELQMEIDRNLAPQSFYLENSRIKIELNRKEKELSVPNVFGIIEGSDPDLKDEVVIYVAHFDHIGTDGEGGIFNGADDNASGTSALIEIAEAFLKEKKQPRRSIGILWVSGEEIGLFGSQYFAENPLVPVENIAAVINLDMIGRSRTKEDDESNRPGLTIMGGDSVKVIGGLQSTVLMDINKRTLDEMDLTGNYEYNDLNHPDRYFYRSDHINFARKDIPVLFYSTGTHRDYHRVTDVEEKIDYNKYLRMTRFGYKVGFNVARYKGPITVDNPMSAW